MTYITVLVANDHRSFARLNSMYAADCWAYNISRGCNRTLMILSDSPR